MSVAAASAVTAASNVGEVLTHPVHGPVRIVSTSTRTVRGEEREYVDLVVIGDEMRISVPTGGRDIVGLRPLLVEKEIVTMMKQLGEPIEPPEKKASWAHRIKSLQMQLQTGRLTDRIEVIRNIVRDPGGVPSSLAERNLLKQAIDPLASEIAIARSIPRDEAQVLLQSTAENALQPAAA